MIDMPPSAAQPQRKITTASVVALVLVILAFVIIALINKPKPEQNIAPAPVVDGFNDDGLYTGGNGLFSAKFPTTPEKSTNIDSIAGSQQYLVEGEGGDIFYSVNIFNYVDKAIYEGSPDYDVEKGLTGAVDGMIQATQGAELISSELITDYYGKLAIRFTYSNEAHAGTGIVTFRGQNMINALVLHGFADPNSPAAAQAFIDSIILH